MTVDTGKNEAVEVHLRQIGEVADLLGLSLRTIRHYEDVGVVVPSGRSPGGFRLYTDADVERLRRVMGMKPIGFSLQEIHEVVQLLDQVEAVDPPPEVLVRLREFAVLAVERLEKHRTRLVQAEGFTTALVALTAGVVALD